MRYSAEHKAQTREKLLRSSGAIAKQGGFANAGVDGLMQAIGLTGGAFYSHFASKNALFAAIVERELSHSLERLGEKAEGGRDKLQRCLDLYLSMAHVRQPDSGCAIPTLGAEIARADIAVREQAEHWLLQLQQAWAKVLEDDALAWAILAQCVGALLLARMLATPQRQEQVLQASRELLGDLLAEPPVAAV
ncbi:TetR/AcrR family transcriptional regulator [Pseudomonas sp. N040]|uniref:TetR/AcrR family transcriptional regulator n=1 Tax=Pseudomonas sp. N040 TaxID=2785325 RepID=UPI0018A2707A|nr:TetR/AcrR family transcriptional regulator [Pseudomonas sp. N040]MBF7730197.1 TetR/AcrR family transcriptional regulator [Pseudomonas sp. N040]MBW7013839.1 TetR/AcrR family transcriptional regulator [Pseudomonas sp. N040]